jgi:transcriptional regulator with XRE-family HTH domain
MNWLNKELDIRGWGYNELARRAGLSSGGVSHVMTGRQNPGYEFCIKVARAMGERPEHILRLAGLLPSLPPEVEEEQEAIQILRELSPQARTAALSMLRGLGGRAQSVSTTRSELEQQIMIEVAELSDDDRQEILGEVQELVKRRKETTSETQRSEVDD